MRDFMVGARVRLAPAVLYLMHFAVAMLVVVSIVEVWQTAVDIVHAITHVDGVFLAAALAAALIHGGAVRAALWHIGAERARLWPCLCLGATPPSRSCRL